MRHRRAVVARLWRAQPPPSRTLPTTVRPLDGDFQTLHQLACNLEHGTPHPAYSCMTRTLQLA
jgi:hypothetical protein